MYKFQFMYVLIHWATSNYSDIPLLIGAHSCNTEHLLSKEIGSIRVGHVPSCLRFPESFRLESSFDQEGFETRLLFCCRGGDVRSPEAAFLTSPLGDSSTSEPSAEPNCTAPTHQLSLTSFRGHHGEFRGHVQTKLFRAPAAPQTLANGIYGLKLRVRHDETTCPCY